MRKGSVGGMNVGRRIAIGGVLVMVAAVVAVAAAGGVAAATGAKLPGPVGEALAMGSAVLGWGRLLLVAVLAAGVLRVRE